MLSFAKGSANKSPTRTPDTLITADTVEILLGVSEGPIKGLVNGPKTLFIDDTSLVNENGKPNFSSFALQFYPGSALGHLVKMELGGFSNPIQVGTELAQNVPVTRTGVTTGIDAIDFRIVVNGLYKQNDKGTFTAPLSLKFEIKKHSDAAWQPAWVADVSTELPENMPPTGNEELWQSFGGTDGNTYSFDGDRPLATSATIPTAAPADANTITVVTGDSTIWSWGGAGWTQEALTPASGHHVLPSGKWFFSPGATPTGARQGDIWFKDALNFLVFNGSSWVKGNQYAPPAVATISEDGIWTIDAKASSATAKDLRVFVPPDEGDVWEFRVTKLSEDSGIEVSSSVTWESIQEIKRKPWLFTNLAMIRVIGQASDQFTRLPNFSGDYDGRIVKVPSNYSPTTRTYTGIWDGTYNLEWTNNPAYIFQDFVENETYGLSSVFPHTVNKWKVYEWGRNCDVMVPRPNGEMRPRWTFNDYLQQPRDAREMAEYIAGSAGGKYVDDGNGVVDVIIDRDEEAVALFTPENVGEDGFVYSYTDRLTRANEVIGEFINPNLNWQADKRRVVNDDDIETFGRISENFIAVGCTDEDEAMARMRRRLITGLTEKELVSFTTNRQGRFLSEMEVILVSDPEMGRGLTGRIRAITGSASASLRDPLTLEAGITYTASFTTANLDYPATSLEPFKVVRRQITNHGVGLLTLNFATNLPTLPEYAAFAIEAEGYVGIPKPYRIMSLDDDSGVGEVLKITALELNRNKYSYIDTGVDLGEIDYGTIGTEVAAPTNLKVASTVRQKGLISTRVLTLSWDRSVSKFVRNYKIVHTLNGTPAASPAPQAETSVEFEGIADGDHYFSVIAVDLFGRESRPASLRWNTNGITPVNGQFDFHLINGTSPTVFQTLDPALAWSPITLTPDFDHYEVLILDEDDTVLRIINVGQALTWRYPIMENRADHGGVAPRTLSLGLRAVDHNGNSSVPDLLTITNPAPPKPTNVTMTLDGDGFLIRWKALINTPDFGGTRIYMSTGAGVAATPENLIFEGPGVQGRIPLILVADYYIRIGHYDLYDPSETIYSDTEFSQNVSVLARDLIDGLAATVEAVEAAQGAIDDAIAGAIVSVAAQEQLAEDVISSRLATIQEIVAREGSTWFEGREIGSIALEALTKSDTSVENLSLIGTRSTDGESFIVDLDTVRVALTETLADRLSLISAKFNGDSASYLLTQITATAGAAGAALDTLSLMGVETGAGADKVFVLHTDKLKVSSTESLLSRLDTIEAKFGGTVSTALLTQIEATATEAGSSLARTTTMGAWAGDNSSVVLDMVKVKASGGVTLADYLLGLQVTNGQIDARADNRISVQIGPGGSIASSISSVQTTANGASALATIALNAVNGNDASIAMLTQVGGKVTGLKIGGAAGDFGILASRFYVVDNSGTSPIVPFLYSGGVVYMPNVVVTNLAAHVVTADKVLANNIQEVSKGEDNSAQQVTGLAPTLISWGMTCSGGFMDIECYINMVGSGGSIGHFFDVYRGDGTYIGQFGNYTLGNQPHNFATRQFRDRPPAGYNSYYIVGHQQAGGGTYSKNVASIILRDNKTQS